MDATAIQINAEEHLGLVRMVAAQYVSNGVPIMDTDEYADGCLGLLDAIKGYNQKKYNTEFSTYATSCIRKAIIQGWRRQNRKKRAGVVCSLDEIGAHSIENRESFGDLSEVVKKFFEPHPDDNETDTRRKWVLYQKFIEDRTWEDIGAELKVTRARSQQIGKEAVEMLRKRFGIEEFASLKEFLSFPIDSPSQSC